MNRFLVLGNMINFINDAEPSLMRFNIQYTSSAFNQAWKYGWRANLKLKWRSSLLSWYDTIKCKQMHLTEKKGSKMNLK